jgi:hypothetical protein
MQLLFDTKKSVLNPINLTLSELNPCLFIYLLDYETRNRRTDLLMVAKNASQVSPLYVRGMSTILSLGDQEEKNTCQEQKRCISSLRSSYGS